jgi:hypothetical protein
VVVVISCDPASSSSAPNLPDAHLLKDGGLIDLAGTLRELLAKRMSAAPTQRCVA